MPTPSFGRLTVTEPPIPDEQGIILPPGVQGTDVECCVVVEVGAECKLHDAGLGAGDRVYFFAGHFAKIGDVKVIDEAAVIAFEKR